MSDTKTIPQKALMVVIALLAINFIYTGLRYIIDPATVAAEFGMPLLDGLGRSSQIGDLSAFFMSMGIFMLLALKTGERLWFYPTVILLSLTALSRVLAWAFQDAALATTMIVAEVVISGLLLLAANKLSSAKE
ncbi:MAG: hypothetical protein ACKVKX_09210 [Pseudomonadales bacterium]|jgi:hypothetical protein|tara:strand:- start:140 stop:541 length:402 start_codon:yes stop_codon:yes gene_type:complete